ncbi:MAG: hypothetical protein CMI27_07155 [Opitutae bacterium]|nr:hypothetical protein [Opitutae bacterium]
MDQVFSLFSVSITREIVSFRTSQPLVPKMMSMIKVLKYNMKDLIKSNFQDIKYSMKTIPFSLFLLFISTFAFADNHEDCALMLGDAIDPEEFSELMGVKVYFCCGACVKAFDGAPAYYVKALPALAKKFSDEQKKELGVDKVKLLDQRFCPIYPERIVNPNSKSIEYNGKKIYFWSSSAERRWKRDPERYFKEAMDRGHLPQYK